jgi:Ser-tRNA(Ala) deacylase AlaX
MTHKVYLNDDALAGATTITEVLPGNPTIVRVDRTWFHAQGGGQKADRGRIGSATVVHVVHNGAFVDHHVDDASGLSVGQAVPFAVDAEWRALNAVFHTAGHLIGSVGEAISPGLRAVAGHQWPGEARVEFAGDVADVSAFQLELQARARDDVAAGLPVRVVGDPFTDRAVQIGDYPPIPCGGTHASSLNALAGLDILQVRMKSGKLRVSYSVTARR